VRRSRRGKMFRTVSATTPQRLQDIDMMEANAQLMTAAPEMFAALEHILADLEMKHPDLRLPAPVESRIRAAIAKATDRVED
jgi:hypothetical protein